MKCVIVEDEIIARKGIESYIEKIDWLECVGSFGNVMELDSYLRDVSSWDSLDMIFLDIELPGISGFDYLTSSEIDAEIIVITAYEAYALQGYELDVTDYLLKPVSFNRFLKAAEKARDYRVSKSCSDVLHKTLRLRVDRGTQLVRTTDILYVEGMENYLKVFTSSGCLIVRMTLKGFRSLVSDEVFVRVHKSYIVNLHNIARIEGNSICFPNLKSVPISRSYRNHLRQKLPPETSNIIS